MIENYPDPPESKEKLYTFTCDCSCKGKISVWAENLNKAEDLLKQGDVNDEEYYTYNIEDILSYEVES